MGQSIRQAMMKVPVILILLGMLCFASSEPILNDIKDAVHHAKQIPAIAVNSVNNVLSALDLGRDKLVGGGGRGWNPNMGRGGTWWDSSRVPIRQRRMEGGP